MLARNLLLFGAPRRSFLFDFTIADALPNGVTLTRASTGQVFGSTLALEQKATDVPRYRYDLTSGLSRGLLIEAQRTNSVQNSTFAGAVAGTPGTAPNTMNWSGSGNNLTRQIVGAGVEDGIEYVDVRFSGTPNASSQNTLTMVLAANVAAAAGQTWTGAMYSRLVGGSLSNLTFVCFMQGRDSGGSAVGGGGSFAPVPTSAALKTQRGSCTATLSGGTTVGVDIDFRFAYTNGNAIDATIRIGLPQLEQAVDASTPIKTTAAAAARSADIVRVVAPVTSYPTWVIRGRGPASGTEPRALCEMTDGTSNSMILVWRNTSNQVGVYQRVGGVNLGNLVLGTIANDTDFALAVRVVSGDIAGSLNGAAVVTSALALPSPALLNSVRLSNFVDSSRNWGGTIKSVEFRPLPEVNAALQSLST